MAVHATPNAQPFDVRHLRAHLRSFAFLVHQRPVKLTTKTTKDTKNLLVPLPSASATFVGLIIGGIFLVDICVPAVDDGASRGAIGQSTQDGAVAFTTTHWSVVLAAQGESAEANAALEKLCRTYWWPIYGFVRREGYKPEEAQDLTQAFFARLLEAEGPRNCQAGKGTFAFLSAGVGQEFSLQGAASRNDRQTRRRPASGFAGRFARARTRRPGAGPQIERGSHLRAALGINIIGASAGAARAEYEAAGKLPLFDRLKELLAGESGQPSQAKIAAEMRMTENAVKQAFHRLRHRYRQLLHEEIANTVAVPDDVEDELRHFMSVLQT